MTSQNELSEKSVDPDPFIQFDGWYKEHLSHGFDIPDSVSLGTSSAEGNVSVRTVLLKSYSKDGFVFYTNYKSKKGLQLSSNNKAAMLFYWSESGRQVRIEGTVIRVSQEESENYFQTRPRESQLSTWASRQSSLIPDRSWLEKNYDYYKKKFSGRSVDKPSDWGGFLLIPVWFEFWQTRDFRLHDRVTYTKNNDLWIIGRLAP